MRLSSAPSDEVRDDIAEVILQLSFRTQPRRYPRAALD